MDTATADQEVGIPAGVVTLSGMLDVPQAASGIVVFVHGSGSSRYSPRNQMVAACLRERGLATLLFDLLTPDEERVDSVTRHLRFDIALLAGRLKAVTDWLIDSQRIVLPVGFFGSSTGAAAALLTATTTRHEIRAIVSRGGRPDLAGAALPAVRAATLLIVGGEDRQVLSLNQDALDRLECEKALYVVPGATHLFEEPGALQEVADTARQWFLDYLQ